MRLSISYLLGRQSLKNKFFVATVVPAVFSLGSLAYFSYLLQSQVKTNADTLAQSRAVYESLVKTRSIVAEIHKDSYVLLNFGHMKTESPEKMDDLVTHIQGELQQGKTDIAAFLNKVGSDEKTIADIDALYKDYSTGLDSVYQMAAMEATAASFLMSEAEGRFEKLTTYFNEEATKFQKRRAEQERLENETLKKKITVLSGIVLLIFVINSGLAFIVVKGILRPLFALVHTTRALAEGRYEQITEALGEDEVGALGRTFNEMVGTLEQNGKDLQQIGLHGHKIVAELSLPQLAEAIQNAMRTFVPGAKSVWVYFSSQILAPNAAESFVRFDGEGQQEETPQEIESGWTPQGFLKFPIAGTKDDKPLGFVFLKHAMVEKELAKFREIFGALAVSMATSAENIRMFEEEKERQKMKAELETAKAVQQALVPRLDHIVLANYELASFYQSAGSCGGDWWYYFPLSEGRLLVLLGDVTGHGVPSALVTAVVKGYCDSIYWRQDISVSHILTDLNAVVGASSDGSRLMTMFALLLDPHNGTMKYSNAGHTIPFYLHNDVTQPVEKNITRLLMSGPRLGYERRTTLFEEKQNSLCENDTIFIFSDGLTEGRSPEGKDFTELRLRKTLAKFVGKSPKDIRDGVKESAFEFYQDQPLEDDVTFVAVHIKGQLADFKEAAYEPVYEYFRSRS